MRSTGRAKNFSSSLPQILPNSQNLDIGTFVDIANLWGVEEPLPVHRFNTAGHNEVGKNPNITLGKREEITGKVFCEFAKKISKKGATILGGCCETRPAHIEEMAKLK